MHPREGWTEGGRPGWLSRRSFLARSAGAGLAMGGLGALLEACGSGASQATSASPIPLPRPNHPVTWPIFADNKPIRSGLAPEKNATLRIYNWVAYLNPKVMKDFGKKYNCQVELTTFNTMSEGMAKMRSGAVTADIFFPEIDVTGPLVYGKLIQPLNHSYIPNIRQAWPVYTNPFYDQHWRYTVPYTIYTTGIAWRKDHVPEDPYTMPNAWAMPWNAKYKGRVAILDDYRESISLALMKNGIDNLNTTDPAQIALAGKSLRQLAAMTNVHIDNNDFTEVPSGQIWIHLAWSGDMATAAYYMPKGVPVDVVGYWFPTNGKGPVNNDTITIPRSAKNPVLAHLFINYLLDYPNALTNYSYTGYMQPINGITPQLLVKEGLLPPSLMSTTVLPSYFSRGLRELQLPPAADVLWEQAWQSVSHGI
jgi:spermidine/putrescine transport system substrate-binding protein